MSKDWESEFASDNLKKFNIEAMLDNLNDDDKKIIYKIMLKHKNVETDDCGVDMMTDKYKLLLRLINMILINVGKKPIRKITEFKNIDRLDIVAFNNNDKFNDIVDNALKLYKCDDIWYAKKKVLNNYILTYLKRVCSDLSFNFYSTGKNIYNKGKVKRHSIYFIKKE